jgi:hypothetical protein
LISWHLFSISGEDLSHFRGKIMKASGKVDMHEPFGSELLDKKHYCVVWFELVGCYRFCQKLQGYNDQVSQAFAENYDGEKAQLGFLLLHVNEETIVEATEMPTEGERWFKKKPAHDMDCNRFLKEEHHNCDWTKSVPKDIHQKRME